MLTTTERRYWLTINLAWSLSLAIGPWLVFEFGKYHGHVEAYREVHSRELYSLEQQAKTTGVYLPPPRLQELQGSEELYGFLSFTGFCVIIGISSVRRHSKWCATRFERSAHCNCGGRWWQENSAKRSER